MNKTLAEYVKRIRSEKNFSLTDVERNSDGEISSSYISHIETGRVANVSPDKLDALAKGLKIAADEIYRVARGLSPEKPHDRLEILAESFNGQELSESDWMEIEAVLKTMIEQKKALKKAGQRKEKK